jgi:hypothetical protein
VSAPRVRALASLQVALELWGHPHVSGAGRRDHDALQLPGSLTEPDAAGDGLVLASSPDGAGSCASLARRLSLCLLAMEREALSVLVRGPMQRLLRSPAFEAWAKVVVTELDGSGTP